MIDESNTSLTEVKKIDDEVLLVVKTRTRRSSNVKKWNHNCCKSQ